MSATAGSAQPSWLSRAWRRRLVRAGAYAIAIAVVLRILLALLLPWLADRAARTRGLACTYRELDLSLFAGTLELHDLELRSRDAAGNVASDPLLVIDYAALDVAMWRSLVSHPTVARAEIDGVHARIDVDADGRTPWIAVLGLDAPSADEKHDERELEPIDFTSPVEVVALRVHDVELDWSDRSVVPPFAARVAADLTLADSSRESHRLELRATSRELFDRADLAANVDAGVRYLRSELHAELAGAYVENLRALLAKLGTQTAAREVAAEVDLEIVAEPREGSERDCTVRVSIPRAEFRAAGELTAAIERLELATDTLLFDSAARLSCALAARVPGVAESLRIDGKGGLDRGAFDAELSLACDGLAPTKLAGWLASRGLASELESGRITARAAVSGELGPGGRLTARGELADVRVADVRLGDEHGLFSIDRATVQGFAFDPTDPVARIADVEIVGTRGSARREASGAWHALGILTLAGHDAVLGDALDAPAAASNGATPTGSSAPRSGASTALAIDHLVWRDNAFEFSDETAPPLALAISDVGAEVRSLSIGTPGSEPTHVKAWLAIEDLCESTSIEGTVAARPDAGELDARLALRLRGLDARRLQPRLAESGIEPTLSDGSFAADLDVELRTEGDAPSVSLALENLSLLEGSTTLAKIDALRAKHAVFDRETRIEAIELEGATVAVARDARGGLHALGLRFAGSAATPPSQAGPSDGPRNEEAPSPWLAIGSAVGPWQIPPIRLGSVRASGLSATWRDESVSPAVDCALEARALVESIATVAGSPPARFEIGVVIHGAVDSLSVSGELSQSPESLAVRASLDALAVRAGPLAAYFPAGLALETDDGRLTCELAAELKPGAEGARSASLHAGPLAWRDGDRRLLSFDRASLEVERVDPAARALEIGDVSLAGLELAVERASPTAWRALGFTIESARAAAAPSTVPTVGEDRAREPAPARVAHGARTARDRVLPTVKLGALDLELAHLEYVDRTIDAPPAPPVVVMHARIATPRPLVLLAPDARELAPLALTITAGLEPGVRSLALELGVAPYADPIAIDARLDVRGLDGSALVSLAPALASTMDARAIADGELGARATIEIGLERRDPTEFEFSRPWRCTAALDELRFKATPDGEVLLGLDAARVEGARFDPSTGDLAIQAIELDRPIVRVRRTANGIECAGVTWRTGSPVPATDAPSEPPVAPIRERVPIEASTSSLNASAAPRSDLSLGRFSISGVDVVARDDSVDPPVRVALDALDVEVRKLSTRDLTLGKPVQFAVSIGSAKQPMPKRVESDSLLEGVAAATGSLLSGGAGDAVEMEERPVFAEIALAGRVSVAPAMEGWATLDVSALELTPFRGLAGASGITIGDGTLDESVRVRFQGERGLSVDARSVFAHLALAEVPGGPVERYLSLPAPLETVLFLLEDFEGEHKVPVSFHSSGANSQGGEIATAATGAAAQVIATAVASSPLRLAGTVTDLFGVTGGEEPPPAKESIRLAFDPGATTPSRDARATLAKLRAKVDRNEDAIVVIAHEFSRADLERARALANPELDDCGQLSLGLRRKKAELDRERGETAASARVAFAMGDRDRAASRVARVRALETELGLTESALDRVHELMKAGTERKREGRARTAALAIASDRIERVRRALLDSGIAADRIQTRQVRVRAPDDTSAGSVVIELREPK